MLAPNEKTNLDEIKYPLLASIKLDGIRCVLKTGNIFSRSLKNIQCEQLRAKFEALRQYAHLNNCILDGEIYSPDLTFQQITHFVMTQDLQGEAIPDDLNFYCFDRVQDENYNEYFIDRIKRLETVRCPGIVHVAQTLVSSKEEVLALFDKAIAGGKEGLILRDPMSRYKCGRGTIKEGLIYKVKPWVTYDSIVTGVDQATAVNEGAEKKTNELGRSVTSKKIGDRHVIDQAANFFVLHNGQELKVSLSSMTHEERDETWANRDSLIGKTIEYKGMEVGMKDLPRHPVFIRYREDKDGRS
jgi:DNA ligase-1